MNQDKDEKSSDEKLSQKIDQSLLDSFFARLRHGKSLTSVDMGEGDKTITRVVDRHTLDPVTHKEKMYSVDKLLAEVRKDNYFYSPIDSKILNDPKHRFSSQFMNHPDMVDPTLVYDPTIPTLSSMTMPIQRVDEEEDPPHNCPHCGSVDFRLLKANRIKCAGCRKVVQIIWMKDD